MERGDGCQYRSLEDIGNGGRSSDAEDLVGSGEIESAQLRMVTETSLFWKQWNEEQKTDLDNMNVGAIIVDLGVQV